jgi:biopolymer transport protein ExbD
MSRRTHYRRRSKEVLELDMTTFLNLMVVLVPFLLITAVFSRITVIELSLPTSEGAAVAAEPSYRVEVIVRDAGLELTDGSRIIAKIPKVEEAYDLRTLSDHVVALKRSHPDDNDASVLLEPDIEYDHLIQVMDVLRSVELPAVDDEEPQRMALFSDVSIGDAP